MFDLYILILSEIHNIQNNRFILANIYQNIPIDKIFKNFLKY